jgi:hypothetical protein
MFRKQLFLILAVLILITMACRFLEMFLFNSGLSGDRRDQCPC